MKRPRIATNTEFRPIPGFLGYDINCCGVVRSYHVPSLRRQDDKMNMTDKPKMLHPFIQKNGYLAVTLRTSEGKAKQVFVHQLVLLAFRGKKPIYSHSRTETRHLNGVKTDNRLENLCWGSSKENMLDQKQHGTWPAGEKNGHAKLTVQDINEIRKRRKAGECKEVLAKEFGVTGKAIYLISVGKLWKCVLFEHGVIE